MFKKITWLLLLALITLQHFILLESCSGNQKGSTFLEKIEGIMVNDAFDEYTPANGLLVLPAHPSPGENFRVVVTGGKNIRNAKLMVIGPLGKLESKQLKAGTELPCWRIDEFKATTEGSYEATLVINNQLHVRYNFQITAEKTSPKKSGVWTTEGSWDSGSETLYSAWVNALFQGCDEQTSWPALHEVTQNKENNFLYNHLSLDEDNPESKIHVLMEPDCADNPFFLRAYFAWKLGLPFGYHVSDRGYVGKSPSTGQWVTNESSSSKNNPVLAFNSFIRLIMNGVHSGTARTALSDENSDYYPVALTREGLRPGTVYADPYGHTFVLVSWIPQTKDHPGVLLAADAQPDKTIAIKRFWRGNFLFNTVDVVGEPGFKAFRPIKYGDGKLTPMKNELLNASLEFAPFSMEQWEMESDVFYRAMERIINPKPLDPEAALFDLITALHEQLLVRVKSVANGEAYFKSHPGAIISMPSSANGIFLTGGVWEDFSTPNRDLRLLIAMDAVMNFPDRVAKYPEDFNISKLSSTEGIKDKLQALLEKKISELTISYTRTDGSEQKLTLKELLERRDAFEMAYNPNDGVEIRWGAPENSQERSTCKRMAPSNQQATMQKVRKWFIQRLHPPT